MPPVLSKPSKTAKQFMVRDVDGTGHVAGIKVSDDEVKTVMRKAATIYQTKVHKNLREAETKRVANAIIQSALDGEVDTRIRNGNMQSNESVISHSFVELIRHVTLHYMQ
jgi:hypothetical protein